MDAELEITWDGSTQGLPDRRLSLTAFGPALRELLAAIKRIASDLEMNARGPARSGGRGRLARDASNLDIQIETVQANSPVTMRARVVHMAPPTMPLVNDLPDRAVETFIRDIRSEAAGKPAHYRVRKFLKVLPEGVTLHRYVHRSGGEVVDDLQLGQLQALPEPPTSPHLVEVVGVLVGLGFETGRSELKIRTSTGHLMTVGAEAPQVEQAYGFRLTEVHVLAVAQGDRYRLLRLSQDAPEPVAPEARADHVFSKWSGLLERLAR